MSGSLPITVPPGGSITLRIAFTPQAAGAADGGLVVTTNAGPVPVSLHGVAAELPPAPRTFTIPGVTVLLTPGGGEVVKVTPAGIGWLYVDGGRLREEGTGEAYRFKGANWFGASAEGLVPDGLWARPYRSIGNGQGANEGLLEQFKRFGFNVIRLLVCQDITWPGRKPGRYIDPFYNPDFFSPRPEAGNEYATPQSALITAIECLDLFVAHAKELGLRVILDMHCAAPNVSNDLGLGYKWYTTTNPGDQGGTTGAVGEPRSEAQMLAAWRFYADRYKDEPTVCGFDLINEPLECRWDSDPHFGIKGFYDRCVAEIREVNTKALIICEGAFKSWNPDFNSYEVSAIYTSEGLHVGAQASGDLRGVASDPVVDTVPNKIVYSPHEYGSYFPGYTDGAGNIYRNYMRPDTAFPANLREIWGTWFGYIAEQGLGGVLIGEVGTWFNTDAYSYSGTKVPYTEQNLAADRLWLAELDEYMREFGIGFTFWCFNPGGEPDGITEPEDIPASGAPVAGDGQWRTTIYPYKQEILDLLLAPDADAPVSRIFTLPEQAITATAGVPELAVSHTFALPGTSVTATAGAPALAGGISWLSADGSRLVDDGGNTIILKSVGWFSLEQDNYFRGTSQRTYKTRPVILNDEAFNQGVTVPHEQEGIVDMVKRAGFNSIRLPISQHTILNARARGSYQVEPYVNPDFILGAQLPAAGQWPPTFPDKSQWGAYTSDPPWYSNNGPAEDQKQPILHSMDMLDRIIAYARQIGLRIILDMHCVSANSDNFAANNGRWYTTASRTAGGASAGTPGEVRDETQAIACWTYLADRYKNEPTVCAFDIINEPHKATWDAGQANLADNVRAYYERVGNAIHAVNPNVFLWFEGVHGSKYVDGAYQEYVSVIWNELPGAPDLGLQFSGNLTGVAAAPVVLNTPNKHGFSPHEYSPSENGAVADFVVNYAGSSGMSQKDVWKARWRKLWGYLAEADTAPIWIGEWAAKWNGTRDAQDEAWFEALTEYCAAHNISHSYWCLNAGAWNGIMLGDDNSGFTGLDEVRVAKIQPMLQQTGA
jgi:aryl-phospho-beta-D-glucosidase BglC (GH1 family)